MTNESEALHRNILSNSEPVFASQPQISMSCADLDAEDGQTPWDELDPPAPLWTRQIDSSAKQYCVQ